MHTISLAGLSPGAETELLVDSNELIEDFNSYTSLVVAHAAGPRCWWMLDNRELVDSLSGSSSSLATGPRRAKDVMPSALRQAMPSSHFLCQCPAMITLETESVEAGQEDYLVSSPPSFDHHNPNFILTLCLYINIRIPNPYRQPSSLSTKPHKLYQY
jgi:hypothetical protein